MLTPARAGYANASLASGQRGGGIEWQPLLARAPHLGQREGGELQGQIYMARGRKEILTAEDFPLVADECRIFARTKAEPILLALDSRMAAEITERLNRDSEFLAIPRLA